MTVESRSDEGKGEHLRRDREAAARAGFIKMGPRKWLLVRCFERVLSPLVRVVAGLNSANSGPTQGEIKNILVIEYWHLGDVVILLPFLRALRQHFPQARISWVVNPKVLPLIENEGLVDELIPIRVPWAQHFSRWKKYNVFSPFWLELARGLRHLRERRFDLALTGRMDIRDNLLVWLSGARRRVGYGVGGGSSFLTDVAMPDPDRPHRTQIWLGLLDYLGLTVENSYPRLTLGGEQRVFAERFLTEQGIAEGELIVGIHPGAGISLRRWGNTNFRRVAERLNREYSARILWFRDPSQVAEGEPLPPGFIPVSLSLPEFVGVVSQCALIICNDSGPMHIADALGVPVVAIFGPQQPAWFGPQGEFSRAVYRPEVWCRPCFDSCIFDQPYCLRLVSIENVYQSAKELVLLNRGRNERRRGDKKGLTVDRTTR
jgi:heptosyltransferase II